LKGEEMMSKKKYVTQYGTFYDELNEDDIKFFQMTDEEIDERCNRLANKALNGIRDKEVIEADARAIRNIELIRGKTSAFIWKKMFGIKNI
jgi:hypothetical protein